MNIFRDRDWTAFGIYIAMVVLNIGFARAMHADDRQPPLPAAAPAGLVTPAAGCPTGAAGLAIPLDHPIIPVGQPI